MNLTQQVPVKIGDQLFQREDGAAFGAVVGIHAHELLVEVEGVGQAVIPAAATTRRVMKTSCTACEGQRVG